MKITLIIIAAIALIFAFFMFLMMNDPFINNYHCDGTKEVNIHCHFVPGSNSWEEDSPTTTCLTLTSPSKWVECPNKYYEKR